MSAVRPRALGYRAWLVLTILSLFPATGTADDGGQQQQDLAAALVVGQRVEVRGRLRGNRFIEASRVRLQDADRNSRVEGPLLAIDRQRGWLTIADFTIVLAKGVSIQANDTSPRSLQDLRLGQTVEARGRWSAGRLDASRLRIRDTVASTYAGDVEIQADIEWVDSQSRAFSVLGHVIALEPDGRLADERTPPAATQLADGRVVDGDGDPVQLRRDVDDRDVPPIRVGEWLTLGGRAGGDVYSQSRLMDDGEVHGRDERANARVQLIASARPGRHVEFYTKVATSGTFVPPGPDASSIGLSDGRLYEAYAALGPESAVGVTIGRQRFRDGREWFYDDYLDAVRMHVQGGPWRFEATLADGMFAGPKELRSRSEQRQTILSLSTQVGRRTDATIVFITRDDPARRERPSWFGGEWNGRVTSAVRYWGLGAMRRGESASESLGGWAIDTGLGGQLPIPGALSLTVSYATATGDPSGGDGVDTRFRQTGLDDNQTRVFGLKRFARYGEVLDPELSNLNVLTVGVGASPWSRTSIDFVYHRYTQRARRRSLPSNRLEATGTGSSNQLGDALDVVLAIQRLRRIDLSMVVGVYRPGPGVASPTRPVLSWKPEFLLFF